MYNDGTGQAPIEGHTVKLHSWLYSVYSPESGEGISQGCNYKVGWTGLAYGQSIQDGIQVYRYKCSNWYIIWKYILFDYTEIGYMIHAQTLSSSDANLFIYWAPWDAKHLVTFKDKMT